MQVETELACLDLTNDLEYYNLWTEEAVERHWLTNDEVEKNIKGVIKLIDGEMMLSQDCVGGKDLRTPKKEDTNVWDTSTLRMPRVFSSSLQSLHDNHHQTSNVRVFSFSLKKMILHFMTQIITQISNFISSDNKEQVDETAAKKGEDSCNQSVKTLVLQKKTRRATQEEENRVQFHRQFPATKTWRLNILCRLHTKTCLFVDEISELSCDCCLSFKNVESTAFLLKQKHWQKHWQKQICREIWKFHLFLTYWWKYTGILKDE